MKTIEEILTYQSQALDRRDSGRLTQFMTAEQLDQFGFSASEPEKWVATPLTRETVLECLKRDLDFAFEKALDRRGLSAGMMFSVIKMWMWVLDEHEDLVNWNDGNYAQYGLPYLKAVALRYNLENPIGDDAGDEPHYSADWED